MAQFTDTFYGFNSLPWVSISDTTSTSTTSSSDSAMTSMFQAVSQGQYMVTFSGCFNLNTVGATVQISLYEDTTQATRSIRLIKPVDGGTLSTNSATGMNGFTCFWDVINPSGATLYIKWNVSSGTAVCLARDMIVIQVA